MSIEEIYSKGFYEGQAQESYDSALVVLDALKQELSFSSVADIGCGVGTWLKASLDHGAEKVFGVDGDYVPRDELLIPTECFVGKDLTQPLKLSQKFDLAISLEVAEHLPPERAESFVSDLCALSDVVLFSGAIPLQGGHNHVNENWVEYWAHFFDQNGYIAYDFLRETLWNNPDVKYWYKQNIVLFCKAGVSADRLPNARPSKSAFSLIHPEHYLRVIRRNPELGMRQTLQADIDYFEAVSEAKVDDVPGYGPEFDYRAPVYDQINSIADILSQDQSQLSPVLTDAVAPVRYKTYAGSPTLSVSSAHPNFLVIGVQKAATTWLHRFFQKHPDIWTSPFKEVNYFNSLYFPSKSAWSGDWRYKTAENTLRQILTRTADPNIQWVSNIAKHVRKNIDDAWYSDVFSDTPNGKIAGDITPEYAMLPVEAINHIVGFNPDIRIVLALRDPVERCLSHLKMIADQAPVGLPVLAEIAKQPSVLERGHYSKIIDRWAAIIPQERFHICFYEDFIKSPQTYVDEIADFLSVSHFTLPADFLSKRIHASSRHEALEARLTDRLAAYYQDEIIEMAKRFPQTAGLWKEKWFS